MDVVIFCGWVFHGFCLLLYVVNIIYAIVLFSCVSVVVCRKRLLCGLLKIFDYSLYNLWIGSMGFLQNSFASYLCRKWLECKDRLQSETALPSIINSCHSFIIRFNKEVVYDE